MKVKESDLFLGQRAIPGQLEDAHRMQSASPSGPGHDGPFQFTHAVQSHQPIAQVFSINNRDLNLLSADVVNEITADLGAIGFLANRRVQKMESAALAPNRNAIDAPRKGGFKLLK